MGLNDRPGPYSGGHPANDNTQHERAPCHPQSDPRILVIARAIGRQIAREQFEAWEEKRRKHAANDNEGK
jgi:hypothetical protein